MEKKKYKYLFCFLLLASCEGDLNHYNRSRFGGEYYKKKKYDNVYTYSTKKPNESKYSKFNNLKQTNNNSIEEKPSKDLKYDKCNGGYYKIGSPYKIFGKTYYPREYNKLTEYGLSSWYGDDFHSKKTANGEIFNMNDMTGAHKTLPLPSIVKIVNVENGKSVIIRINDRGPFIDGRILDVSKRVAHELDFKENGLTDIKIEFLPKETENYLRKCNLIN